MFTNLVSCVVILLLLQGCAGLGSFPEKPKVSIADIQVQESQSMEATFLVQLRVFNPNEQSLEIKGIDCDLEIDGHHFATGITDAKQSIPAYGSALVPVTVYASFIDMVTSVFQIIQSDSVQADGPPLEYKVSGRIRAGTSGFSQTFPFDSTGKLSMDNLGASGNP